MSRVGVRGGGRCEGGGWNGGVWDQYSWNANGKEHELYGRQKAFKNGSKRMIDMYKLYTGKSERYIRKHLLGPTDVWLTASQAKKHNIIDNVK